MKSVGKRRSVARVWCGIMPRVGSKSHMRTCPDCRRTRRAYWDALRRTGFSSNPLYVIDHETGTGETA